MYMMTTYTTNRADEDLIAAVKLGTDEKLETLIEKTFGEIQDSCEQDDLGVSITVCSKPDGCWIDIECDELGNPRSKDLTIEDIKRGLSCGDYSAVRVKITGGILCPNYEDVFTVLQF